MKIVSIMAIALFAPWIAVTPSFGTEPEAKPRQHLIDNPKCTWKLDVELNHSSGIYRVGEELKVSVVAPRDCYLHIININPKGEFSVLWPLKSDGSSRVTAQQRINFPATDAQPRVSFKASEPTGKELIVCFATTRPLNLQTEQDKKLFHDFMQGLEQTMPDSMGRIKSFVTMVQQDDAGWTAQAVEVTTVTP